jgi:hypothetical protein
LQFAEVVGRGSGGWKLKQRGASSWGGNYKGVLKEEGAVPMKMLGRGRLDLVYSIRAEGVWEEQRKASVAKGFLSFKVLGGC